jgi:hypothetical protein
VGQDPNLVNQDMEQVHLWALPMPKVYPETSMLDPQGHPRAAHRVSNLVNKVTSNNNKGLV